MRLQKVMALLVLISLGSCGKSELDTRSQLGFSEPFDQLDEQVWKLSDSWANDSPFYVGWRKDQISLDNGVLNLGLSQEPCADQANCSNYPQASAELQTLNTYGFGSYTARLKAAKGSGLVTGFFTYIGPSEGQVHDEIDVEILGKNTNQVQFNYYTQGQGGHETVVDLGFDGSLDFHDYQFEWSSGSIRWFVDGVLKHEVVTSGLPQQPGHIFLNLWAGIGVDPWLGPFTYTAPVNAQIHQVTWTP